MLWTTVLIVTALVLSACGSGNSSSHSSDATALLKQTFSGPHTVNSGVLDFTLTLTPAGSKLLTGPVTLSLSGPFQSRGTEKLPASDFTLAITAQGLHGALAVVSTGTKGYVTLSGTSYELPGSSFRKLEAGFAAAEAPAGGTSSASGPSPLQRLGISPLHWLSDPTVVGQEPIAGTPTTHLRAKVNVAALLSDISHLASSSKLHLAGAANLSSGITASEQAKIVGEVGSPSFGLWTGNADKTARKLSLDAVLPVTGAVRHSLRGMTSVTVALTLEYSDLNKPQTISAPTKLKPYKLFQGKIDDLMTEVLGVVGGATNSSGSTTATGTTTQTPIPGNPSAAQKYSACITKADGDVTKMQKCSALVGGG